MKGGFDKRLTHAWALATGRSPPLPAVEPKVEAANMRLPEVHNCAHFRARQTMVAHGIIPAQRILPLLETVNLKNGPGMTQRSRRLALPARQMSGPSFTCRHAPDRAGQNSR